MSCVFFAYFWFFQLLLPKLWCVILRQNFDLRFFFESWIKDISDLALLPTSIVIHLHSRRSFQWITLFLNFRIIIKVSKERVLLQKFKTIHDIRATNRFNPNKPFFKSSKLDMTILYNRIRFKHFLVLIWLAYPDGTESIIKFGFRKFTFPAIKIFVF